MENVRERWDAYQTAIARAVCEFRAGRATRLALEPIDDGFGEISGGDLLEALRKQYEGTAFVDAREGWRRLWLGLLGATAAARTRGLAQELCEREAAQTARVDGALRTLYDWKRALGAETDAARRQRIVDALDSGRDEVDAQQAELHARTSLELGSLGFATPRAFAEALHPGLDYESWGRHAARLLEATESAHRDALRGELSRIGADPTRADRGDLARALHLDRFDTLFPARALRACVDFVLEGMGLRLADVPGLALDLEPRPRKHPRASCAAIRVPGEIEILLAPRGGGGDYETLFHRVGHALQLAFTSPALPVERRRGGDPALGEAFACLLGCRMGDPAWTSEGPAAARADELETAMRFRRLARLRSCAGKIRYQLELSALAAGADPAPLAERYAEEQRAATGVGQRAAGYLVDVDPVLHAVDRLRGACLEVQLAEHLRARFGRRFWKQRRAGDLLKEVWNTGSTYTADALASQLGLGAVDIEPLLESLRPR